LFVIEENVSPKLTAGNWGKEPVQSLYQLFM